MKNLVLVLYLLVASTSAHAQWYWGSANGKNSAVNLTKQISNQNDVKTIEFGVINPSAVATSASQGSIYIGSTQIFQKQDNGSSTNWTPLLIGPAGSGTDECVARWNGTGVPALQDSIFCITDAGIATGLTQFNLENLRLDGNTVSSTSGDLVLDPTGSLNLPDSTPSRPLKVDGSRNVIYSQIDLASANDITGLLPITNLADGTANQIIGANAAGNANEFKSLAGTANQVSVTHGVGTVTFSTPQDIAVASSPTFAGLTLTAFSGFLKATAGVVSTALINLASDVTGVLPDDNGGTSQSTYATGDTLYASAANTLSKLTVGTNGQFYVSNGSIPVWTTVAATGAQSVGAIDTVGKSANGAVISGTALIFQTADATFPGLISMAAQTFGAGIKTIAGIIDSTLTTGRVVFTSASGRLVDSASFLFNSATNLLTVGATSATSTTLASIPNNPMTTAQRTALTPSTGSCVFDTDLKSQLCYDGTNWALQGVQPNSTSWTAYTPTFSGFTASSSDCQYRYDGADQLIRCRFTVSTTAATNELVSLANGDTSASSTVIPTPQAGGVWFAASTTTSHGGVVIIEPSVTYVLFGSDGTFSNVNVNAMTAQNGSTLFGTNSYNFTARVPVASRAATIGTYSATNLGTMFSAKLTSAGVVSDENANFINGNAAVAASVYTVTFTGAFFSVAPNCTATTTENGTTSHVELSSVSASQVVWKTSATTTGTPTDKAFNISCQKTGADFTAANMVTATFKDTVTAPNSSNGSPKEYIATVNCDAGSTITNETYTGVPTIANIASGSCVVTIPVDNFSNIDYVSCSPVSTDTSTSKVFQMVYTSTTSLTIHCSSSTAGTDCTTFDVRMVCKQL